MKKSIKQIVPLLAGWLIMGAVAVCAAPGPADVARTAHNLSSTPVDEGWSAFPGLTRETYATQEDEVCVFCHTPHGGSNAGPLWNHNLPTSATWSHYNSATLGETGAGAGVNSARSPSNESLLCLSCHDGSVATNHVINPNNDLGAYLIDVNEIENINQGPGGDPVYIEAVWTIPAARIGGYYGSLDSSATGHLEDDHPISFSYDDALIDDTELHTVDVPKGKSIRFFGATNRVECSSCHDPHVKYDTNLDGAADPSYAPFLITTNEGSAMCLACHNK